MTTPAADRSSLKAFTHLPVTSTLFQTAPIGLDARLRITLVATAAKLVVSVDKARIRSRIL
ncbi:MAG TPA: hypothetical protein VK964_00610 [Nocardioidaceae bacterium]|nr:hypothetical protein [Nocardioidaceae bacterium]